jgi:DNA-binding MarR family transcriptional regulator
MNNHEMRVVALHRLLDLTVLLHDDATRSLARDGLTTSRATVLWHVRRRGPATQRELAHAMNVSARTITGLVDALVDTGFVTREPHPTDRRANLVTFTDHGTRTVEAMERQQQQFVDLLFGEMPDERFRCFVDGLDDLLRRLEDLGLRRGMDDAT